MNEAQTRIDLIDDELRLCGWNIDDKTKVIEEYEIELDDTLPPHFDRTKRFVDYALLNKTGHIIAIVEAKRANKAVISMPSGVFKPYAGVSTAVLVFVKGGSTEKVWFYDMEADGYSLDDKRNKIEQNDIPNILEQYKYKDNQDYKNTKKHFFVDVAEIIENDYDLSINRYKEIEYEEVEYPPTDEILDDIERLPKNIANDLKELKELL